MPAMASPAEPSVKVQAAKISAKWEDPLLLRCKRTFDVVISGALLLLLFPIMLVVAILVRTSSPGPIIYRWPVVGKHGIPFTGYKFRSMYINADKARQELHLHNEMQGPVFKMRNDPRVTPLGRWLRKYSLDELPQLWSVLTGDMSLVGPRPPLQIEYEQFAEWQKTKLAVKPGITCLWQVSGRNEIKNFDDWVRLDLEYMKQWSLWLDFKILVRTIPAVVLGKGR
jgi:lipopolysaccharide/colanic/teichoic acid biosynthesis glycosyltransferase